MPLLVCQRVLQQPPRHQPEHYGLFKLDSPQDFLWGKSATVFETRFLPKKISRLVIMNLTFLPAFCWVLECKAVDCSLLGTYASDWNRHSLPASFAQLLLGTKRPKGARNPAACGSWVSQIVNVHMKRVQIDLTNIILSFPGACQTLQPLDRNDESASKPLPVRHSTWFPKEPEEIHTNLLNLSI